MIDNILREALNLFGENGERWTTGSFKTPDGCYCSLGAIAEAGFEEVWEQEAWDESGDSVMADSVQEELNGLIAVVALADAIEDIYPEFVARNWKYSPDHDDLITEFNDSHTWPEVKAVFERAIELAEEA
ncbi:MULTISPECIES: DUF6197 family protein [Nocardia]|uniref:DUF6197 family protein n=1 Tax=Nocardia TaxID=1817 RepID=UPI0007A4489B|nr:MULTISPECIES: hypothetical protein [Nocardia]